MSYLRCLVRVYPQLFVGELMSYLRCLVRVYPQLFVVELMSYLRCLVRVYPQLFVGGLMSYLRYLFCLCLVVANTYCVGDFLFFVFVLCLVYGGVQHIVCSVFCFVCLRLASCVANVASFSGMSIRDCPFSFSNIYFI